MEIFDDLVERQKIKYSRRRRLIVQTCRDEKNRERDIQYLFTHILKINDQIVFHIVPINSYTYNINSFALIINKAAPMLPLTNYY